MSKQSLNEAAFQKAIVAYHVDPDSYSKGGSDTTCDHEALWRAIEAYNTAMGGVNSAGRSSDLKPDVMDAGERNNSLPVSNKGDNLAPPTNDTLNDCRDVFEKWFHPNVHNEKSLKTLGLRTMLWSAFQIGWNAHIPSEISVMGEASPKLADARLDASEVHRSAVCTMEETSPANLLDPDMPVQELYLHMGELTAQEVRTARAAIRWANSVRPTKREYRELSPEELAVIRAAETFILADIMVTPNMSREQAVKSGYDKLELAVNRYHSGQPATQIEGQ